MRLRAIVGVLLAVMLSSQVFAQKQSDVSVDELIKLQIGPPKFGEKVRASATSWDTGYSGSLSGKFKCLFRITQTDGDGVFIDSMGKLVHDELAYQDDIPGQSSSGQYHWYISKKDPTRHWYFFYYTSSSSLDIVDIYLSLDSGTTNSIYTYARLVKWTP